MIAQSFSYYAPSGVNEALHLLQQYGDRVRVLAGGQELVPAMTTGELTPNAVLDMRVLRTTASLTDIVERDGSLVIGSMVTHRAVECDSLIRTHCALLADAAAAIGGGVQVRNKGTIGGGICRANPSGDYLAPMVALDAVMHLESLDGERSVKARDFFLAPFTTAMLPGELLMNITVPMLTPGSGTAYYKLAFTDGCYTIVSAACAVELAGNGTCASLRLALGGVARRPIRLTELEQELIGKHIDDTALSQLAQQTASFVKEPLSDVQADGAYRQQMAGIIAKRALQAALARCGRHTSSERTQEQ